MVDPNSIAAFTTALEHGDHVTAARVLDETSNFESLGPDRGEFLRRAVELCNFHGVKMLLERGIRLPPEQAGVRPLLPSSGHNLELCRMLVELGVDINEQSAYGSTALHRAVMFDVPEACAYLLEHGADPNLLDSDHKAPMHHLTFATAKNALAIAHALVDGGARSSIAPALPPDDYLTPFQYLVEDGKHVHVVEFLIDCGEDLAQTGPHGRTLQQITIVTRMRESMRAFRVKQQVEDALNGPVTGNRANGETEAQAPRRRALEPF
jgi:hypothetical protein